MTPLCVSRTSNYFKKIEKWRICSIGANSPFSIKFSKFMDAKNTYFENFQNLDIFIENDVTVYK